MHSRMIAFARRGVLSLTVGAAAQPSRRAGMRIDGKGGVQRNAVITVMVAKSLSSREKRRSRDL